MSMDGSNVVVRTTVRSEPWAVVMRQRLGPHRNAAAGCARAVLDGIVAVLATVDEPDPDRTWLARAVAEAVQAQVGRRRVLAWARRGYTPQLAQRILRGRAGDDLLAQAIDHVAHRLPPARRRAIRTPWARPLEHRVLERLQGDLRRHEHERVLDRKGRRFVLLQIERNDFGAKANALLVDAVADTATKLPAWVDRVALADLYIAGRKKEAIAATLSVHADQVPEDLLATCRPKVAGARSSRDIALAALRDAIEEHGVVGSGAEDLAAALTGTGKKVPSRRAILAMATSGHAAAWVTRLVARSGVTLRD